MACYVRLMRREDVAPVNEIDREAFPTLWPPTNYRHELQNPLAHYIVAADDKKTVPRVKPTPKKGLLARVHNLFSRDSGDESPASETDYIFGFTGFWIMADEAHITNIAVREHHRRQGIGELLLIAAIDQAIKLKARSITLEVRVSNTAAQSLYRKYGFIEAGLRRGYYTDNREDAVLMTIENISAASFRAHLQQLKQAYASRWVWLSAGLYGGTG